MDVLVSFSNLASQPLRSDAVFASAQLDDHFLYLRFEIHNPNSEQWNEILFPERKPVGERKSHLWEETCFECFIAASDGSAYLEFNGAPSGSWDFYAFESYRKGQVVFQLEKQDEPQNVQFEKEEHRVLSVWKIPLNALKMGFESVKVQNTKIASLGLTTVLKTKSNTYYWALIHSADKPDFHLRASFIYDLS